MQRGAWSTDDQLSQPTKRLKREAKSDSPTQSIPEFLDQYADLQNVVFPYLSVPDLRSYALELQQARGDSFQLQYSCLAMQHLWDRYLQVCYVFPRPLRCHPDYRAKLFATFFEADVELSSICYDCLAKAADLAEMLDAYDLSDSEADYLPLGVGLYRNRCTWCLINQREKYGNYVLPMRALFDNIPRVERLAEPDEEGNLVHEVSWDDFDDYIGTLIMDDEEVHEAVEFKGAMWWGITLDNKNLFLTVNDVLVLMEAWCKNIELVPSPPVLTTAMLTFRAKLQHYKELEVWLQEFRDLDFSPPDA